jgi:hypothetical protein
MAYICGFKTFLRVRCHLTLTIGTEIAAAEFLLKTQIFGYSGYDISSMDKEGKVVCGRLCITQGIGTPVNV